MAGIRINGSVVLVTYKRKRRDKTKQLLKAALNTTHLILIRYQYVQHVLLFHKAGKGITICMVIHKAVSPTIDQLTRGKQPLSYISQNEDQKLFKNFCDKLTKGTDAGQMLRMRRLTFTACTFFYFFLCLATAVASSFIFPVIGVRWLASHPPSHLYKNVNKKKKITNLVNLVYYLSY